MNRIFISLLLKFTFLLAMFFLFSCSQVNDKKQTNLNIIDSDSLIRINIDTAYVYFGEGEYSKCDSVVKQAQKSLTNENDTSLRLTLLFIQTELIKQKGNYDDCLLNYFKAVKLAKLSKDSMRLALAYYNISSVNILNQRIDKAEDYCLKSLAIFSSIKDSIKLTNCFVQLSIIYKNKQDFSQSKLYLNKAIKFYKSHNYQLNLAICYNNLGNNLLGESNLEQAIEYYKKAVEISKALKSPYGLAIRYGNIAEAYLKKNEFKIAKLYIDSSMTIAKKIEAKETILSNYERLKVFYKSTKHLDSALQYSNQYTKLKVELVKLESDKINKELENKYKDELQLISAKSRIDLLEKDKLVKHKDQERIVLIFIFVIILILLIAISIYVYYRKQKRIAKMDAQIFAKEKAFMDSERKLNIAEIKNKEQEKQQLEKELEYKSKELVNFALQIVEKNDFLEELLIKIKENDNNSKQDLIHFIKQNTFLENEKEEFQANIEQVNEAFFFKLRKKFSNLTKDEERLSALLRINLSSKEISAIFNISPSSVDMKRYRLRKKLQLTKDENITDFLNQEI